MASPLCGAILLKDRLQHTVQAHFGLADRGPHRFVFCGRSLGALVTVIVSSMPSTEINFWRRATSIGMCRLYRNFTGVRDNWTTAMSYSVRSPQLRKSVSDENR